MSGLLQGRLTPQQWGDEIQKAADKVAADPNIPKHQP